jgi:hypothetical protein
MTPSSNTRRVAPLSLSIAFLAVAVSGCASTRPVAYRDLDSSAHLRANTRDESGRIPYSYSEKVDWRQYKQVIVAPVTVYQGADAQFEKTSEEDRKELSKYMHAEFSEKLSERFQLVQSPSDKALRVQLTLTGAKTSTQVVSTFTHFDLAGTPYNVVQGVRGKEGLMMGSVSYAVEIYDAATNRLLNAFVAKQFPNAMNVKSTFGSLRAAKTGIDKGATALVAQLD